MRNTLLVLKPSIANAVIPIFAKYFFRSLVIVAVIYGIFMLLQNFGLAKIQNSTMPWFGAAAFFLSIAPLTAKMFVLYNTRYYFYQTHIASEFKFFRVKRVSAPYAQIVNINTHISLWDRLSGAGDIILHTAENKAPDIVLSYISKPQKIEGAIYRLIQQHSGRNAR